MDERDDVERRDRRLLARQHLEALVLQRLLDGAQTVRPLGMAGGREMVEAGGMAERGEWTLTLSNAARLSRKPC